MHEPHGPAGRRRAVELPAFFARLRQALAERRMSQADLARELGVGVATVSEWFTRGRVPNGDVMLRLPRALGVSGHWLLTGEGPTDPGGLQGADPYRRGARDALARASASLREVERHFAGEAEAGPPRPPVPGG